MTIRQRIQGLLEANGVWPDEARKVLEIAEIHPHLAILLGQWDREMADYPIQLLVMIWIHVQAIAVAYLEPQYPRHYSLPLLKQGNST